MDWNDTSLVFDAANRTALELSRGRRVSPVFTMKGPVEYHVVWHGRGPQGRAVVA